MVDLDLDWAANANWSQRKNDFLVVDNDPDSDAPAVPRDILLRDPDSDGVSFRATLNNQLVLTNGVSLVTINARGGTTKAEVLSVSGGPTIITPQPRSTGLLTGGEIVAGGVPASEYTVETGSGVIWDGTTAPATPTLTATITWAEFTDETTIGVETFVYITSAGALNLSASKTPALDRSHIFLGVVLDSGTSLTIINAPITANQIGSYVSDLYAEIAIMINDVVITPNANLTVENSAGTAFGQSINWHTDRTTPNQITIAANDPMPMTYVTQDGDFAASTVTNMDVANYNPTGNTISAIGGGARNSTNQRIYITPFGFATLYGQNIFSSLDAAVDGADTENPVVPEWLLNYGTLLVTVSVIRTATDLSDDTEAKFNYSAAGGSAGDNHDHSRLDSPDGLLTSVVQTTNAGDVEILDDLVHSGDTDTLISFTDDAMTLEAGGEVLITLTEGAQDVVKLGDGGDVDINLNDDVFVEASSGNVGFGTAAPASSARLHVVPAGDGDAGFHLQFASATGRAQMRLADELGAEVWRFGITAGGGANFAFFDGTQDAFVLFQNGRGYFNGNGNFGIRTTVPGQILDVNQGGGNVIADGYDNHSLSEYKEEIIDAPPALASLRLARPKRWRRRPHVSAMELRAHAIQTHLDEWIEEFGGEILDGKLVEDDFRGGKLQNIQNPELKAVVDAEADRLRAERRLLPRWQRRYHGLVADEQVVIDNMPDVLARGDDGEVSGINLDNYIGKLHQGLIESHQIITDLQNRVRALEQV